MLRYDAICFDLVLFLFEAISMITAHKIELKPNNKQATYFAKACGTARFAYNWALEEWKKQNEAGLRPTETALRRQLNSIKRDQFPWMLEVTKNAPQMAIMYLGQAFKRFFKGVAQYPQFKKKGFHDSFTLTNDQFSVTSWHIRVPHIGEVRLCESLRFVGKILSATISRVAHKWFVSITVEVPSLTNTAYENQGVVGVDLGVKQLATLSTGEVIEGPKPHKNLLGRLKRLSRSLSRKKKDSQNRQKAKRKLSRLHARIAFIRKDALHKLTTSLSQRFHTVVVEDLNVQGMMKNRCLSRSIADMGFYEFKRHLSYKLERRKGRLVLADRFYPSSQLCSQCGYQNKELKLSERVWQCPSCQASLDRDHNASLNLKNLAASSAVTACGEGGSGSGDRKVVVVKPPRRSKKQSLSLSTG